MTLEAVISFLIILSFLSTHRTCEIFKDTLGVTSPSQDIFLRNGTPLTLNCTLYPENFLNSIPKSTTSQDIIFYKDGTKLVSRSLVHVLNKYTAQLRIENVSEDDGGFYKCFIHLPESKGHIKLVQDVYVCGNIVKVGVPPQLIRNEDFNCVSLNWQNMTCSWKQAPNQIPTTYYLSYSFPLNGNRRSKEFKCPTYKTKNSCFFGSDVRKQRVVYKQSAQFFIFKLIGKNELGTSSKWYLLRHFNVVIPNRPVDFRTRRIGKDSLLLEWKSPLENDLFPPGLNYELKYRSTWDKPNEWKVALTKNKKIEIKHLNPHTWYVMRLRCKSGKAENEEKWWSTFSTLKVLTDSDVPKRAPKTVNGMFEDHWFENAKRSITVYWEPLPVSEWNGKNFTYEIRYTSQRTSFENNTRKIIHPNTIRRKTFFAKIMNLEAERSYTFNIVALNSVGLKPDVYSTLNIEKKSKLPEKPNNIMAKLLPNGSYFVSWKMKEKGIIPVKSFTVFWCKRHTFNECDKPLNFKEVSRNQTNLILDVSGSKSTFYHFAVSSNSEEASSGMIWATCLISANGAPGKVQQLRAEPISSTKLKVDWKLGCVQEFNNIKGYYIHDCKSVDSESCSVPMNKQFVKGNRFFLFNREPYSIYLIKISSVSLTNEESDPTEPYVVRMPEGIPNAPDMPKLINVTNSSIFVAWNRPDVTNGVIRYYFVNYNRYSVKVDSLYEAVLSDYITPFKRYQVSVSACTSKGCSKPSSVINVTTEIGVPSKMAAPRIEIINATYMKVYWERPEFENGPIGSFHLLITWKTNSNKTVHKNYTFSSWRNRSYLTIDCSSLQEGGKDYSMKIRAGIFRSNNSIYGPWSNIAKVKTCMDVAEVMKVGFIVGIIIGCTFAITIIVLIIHYILNRAKERMEAIHKVNIQLPKGLGEMTKKSMSSLTQLASHSNNNRSSYLQNNLMTGNNKAEFMKDCNNSENSAFSSISAQMSMFLDRAMSKGKDDINRNSFCCEVPPAFILKSQTSYQSSDSGMPSDSDYFGSPLPSPGQLFFEDLKLQSVKNSSTEINPSLQRHPIDTNDNINNNSEKYNKFEDTFNDGKKQLLNLDLFNEKYIEQTKSSDNFVRNTDAVVGFALRNFSEGSANWKLGELPDDGNNILKNRGFSKLNRSIAGSESNIADADSGHGSDTNNDEANCNSLSHYAYFGLSNSYTDISGNKMCSEKQMKSNGCYFKSNKDVEMKLEMNDEKPTCKKFSNYRAPYSKFGLLNTYVTLPSFESKVNAPKSTKDSNPGYITMNEIKNIRSSSKENLKRSHLNTFASSEDDISVFFRPEEEINISLDLSPKIHLRQRIHRDSGISVSSPTKENVNFNGYVPNSIFSCSQKKEQLNERVKNDVENSKHKKTFEGYVLPDTFHPNAINYANKELCPSSLPSQKSEHSTNGYIRHELLLKAGDTFTNRSIDSVYSTNERSIWV